MWIASFPGAVIDGVSFVDYVFRGVRSTEVVEAGGSILFRNVRIKPAEGRSPKLTPEMAVSFEDVGSDVPISLIVTHHNCGLS